MSSIQASLRRPILPNKDRGNVVPDSKPKKAANPKLEMTAGVVRPVFKFADGLGLIDQFGNVYDGYNGAGGDSLSVSHTPAESVDGEIDSTASDLDFIQYDGDLEKFVTRNYSEAQLMQLTDTIGPVDRAVAVYDNANGWWRAMSPKDFADEVKVPKYEDAQAMAENVFLKANASGEFLLLDFETEVLAVVNGLKLADAETVDSGDVLRANASGEFQSVPNADFISGIIEVPQDRAYILVDSLPYDITITATNDVTEGTASIAFPSGTILAGNPIEITVSGSSGAAEFLRFQIDFNIGAP